MKAHVIWFALFLLGVMSAPGVEPREMKATEQWQGSVDAGHAPEGLPNVVVNAVDFAKVWEQCGRAEKPPAIDWAKQFVIFETTSGSRLNLRATLDADGKVKIGAIGTRDFRPGFRYVLAVFSREGVTTLDGRRLP